MMSFNPMIWGNGGGGYDGPSPVTADSLLRSYQARQAREDMLTNRNANGRIYVDPREGLPVSQGGFNPDPTTPPVVPVVSVAPVAPVAASAAPVAPTSTAPAGASSLMPLVALGVILYLVFK
jgi:hypothetical protein